MPTERKSSYTKFKKIDEELGLVMGFAIVCKEGGKDYFDLQGDHIPEDAMLDAATDFMRNSRKALQMHSGGQIGEIVFAFPLTTDIAKAFDIDTPTTGLMIAMRPESDEVMAKFRSGEYTGFSMGGAYLENESV